MLRRYKARPTPPAPMPKVLLHKYNIDKLIFQRHCRQYDESKCLASVVYHDAELSMIMGERPFRPGDTATPRWYGPRWMPAETCGVKAIAGKIATGDTFVGDAAARKPSRKSATRLRGDGKALL